MPWQIHSLPAYGGSGRVLPNEPAGVGRSARPRRSRRRGIGGPVAGCRTVSARWCPTYLERGETLNGEQGESPGCSNQTPGTVVYPPIHTRERLDRFRKGSVCPNLPPQEQLYPESAVHLPKEIERVMIIDVGSKFESRVNKLLADGWRPVPCPLAATPAGESWFAVMMERGYGPRALSRRMGRR